MQIEQRAQQLSGPAAPAIAVRNLEVAYRTGRGSKSFRAVDGVTFEVAAGATLGLIGESGSGKSTVARALVGLAPVSKGVVEVDGAPVTHRVVRRGTNIQMVFQDPHAALNPRMTVLECLADPLKAQRRWRGAASRSSVLELLGRVGLSPDLAGRRSHQLSGGQKQRVNIARALVLEPRIVLLDEAVSALDLSVQADVINLLLQLQQELSLTYVFISHDLSVIRHVSDVVAVMYLGQIVEYGPADVVTRQPTHPYTEALLFSEPTLSSAPDTPDLTTRVRGEIPSAIDPPSGCRFRTRCAYAQQRCAETVPPLAPGPSGTRTACHRADELQLFSVGLGS